MMITGQYKLFFYWILFTSILTYGFEESSYCPSLKHKVPSPCTDKCTTDKDCLYEGAVCCYGGCINEEATLATNTIQYYFMCIKPELCDMHVCQNNATCVPGLDSYTCVCPKGFVGTNCSINVTGCHTDPCQNGGECIETKDDYKCCCPIGKTGKNCEQDLGCQDSIYYKNQCTTCEKYNNALCIMKPHYYVKRGSEFVEVTDECVLPED